MLSSTADAAAFLSTASVVMMGVRECGCVCGQKREKEGWWGRELVGEEEGEREKEREDLAASESNALCYIVSVLGPAARQV